jgi:hypothetical protein
MVAARDAIVLDNNEEPVPPEQFAELLQQTNMSAAVLYAVVIGEDHRMWL